MHLNAEKKFGIRKRSERKESQLGLSKLELIRFEIPFSQKTDERFKGFIERLTAVNAASIYLWTGHVTDCRALKFGVRGIADRIFNKIFVRHYDYDTE